MPCCKLVVIIVSDKLFYLTILYLRTIFRRGNRLILRHQEGQEDDKFRHVWRLRNGFDFEKVIMYLWVDFYVGLNSVTSVTYQRYSLRRFPQPDFWIEGDSEHKAIKANHWIGEYNKWEEFYD